jgi:hypothetical protein
MLSTEHMHALPAFFADIPDPRRGQGRRHPLPSVLAIAAAAVLRGLRGCKAISQWAEDLSQQARARFRCRYRQGRHWAPRRSVLSAVLIGVGPAHLDQVLHGWNAQYAGTDEGLAIDGKTPCNALDEAGRQTHVLGVVGHETHTCYTQKRPLPSPSATGTKPNKPTTSGRSSRSSNPLSSPARPSPPTPC